MSVGSGIFFSTVLVLLVVGVYHVTTRRKWALVGKVCAGVVLLLATVVAGGWAWSSYKARPVVVEELEGVRLGMTTVEVKLLKGAPNNDATASPETRDGKSSLFWWFKESHSDKALTVLFTGPSPDALAAVIVCDQTGSSRVFGLGRYSSEADITAKLGQPTRASISSDGLAKLVSYNRWNVAFGMAKGSVTEVCISSTGAVVFTDEHAGHGRF
ncbi:MAG: hypothetical protein Q8L86_02185 [Vicinamibacterales bacterium]|nr:hypothetical protein [Vicinamibacterales bacterium]